MRYFIISIFVLLLVSCKKKKTQEPEVLPDTSVDHSYSGRLESELKIDVGSHGPVDSIFEFNASLVEDPASSARPVGFNAVSYNSKNTGTVYNGVSFLDFANRSTWDLQSEHIGNFTHIDNTPIPLIGNPLGALPPTFAGGAFTIQLQNISGVDEVVVSSFYNGAGSTGSSQKVRVIGPSMAFNFTEGVNSLPLNTDIRITVGLWKYNKLTRNKAEIEVNKVTSYVYKIRKTS